MPKLTDALIQEFEQEAPATRKCLERIPEDKLSWKPHEKSYTLGQLALHVAATPGMAATMLSGDSIDMPEFKQDQAASRSALLSALDESLKAVRESLGSWDDARATGVWKVTKGGKEMMAVPRIAAARMLVLSHHFHHRGQLTVYLRLLGVPVPAVYGPSADENPFA